MKIALIGNCFLPDIGGIEIVMLNIGAELARRGHDVTVLTSRTTYSRQSLKSTEEIRGITVRRFRVLPLPIRQIFLAPGIVPDLVKGDYDIVHVFSYGFSFITNVGSLISAIRRRALVMTPIYNPIRTTLYTSFLTKCAALAFDERIGIALLRMANVVTALSESEAVFYRKHGIINARVIPEGIEIPRPCSTEVKQFISKHSLRDGVVLSVGRMTEYKGQDHLIRAFAIVLNRFPDAKLLIIGEDQGYLPTLLRIVGECNCESSVIFTGRVSQTEVDCAYESADFVVHTSRFETFARIALEAWSHKKPIICFDLGGPTDFITEDKGILAPCGDIERLAASIVELLSNRSMCKAMGENGYRAVRSRHLWKGIVDEYEHAYELAMHNRHTHTMLKECELR